MQSNDQKICLGQEFVHLFIHSFIYWSFLYPQSMRKYKPIVTRPLVHNDCAQGTTQGPHKGPPAPGPQKTSPEACRQSKH